MPFAALNGQQIFFEEKGKGKPGTPLVFIHGAGGNQYIWQQQVNALAQDRWVIAVDLPGHGKSEGLAYSSIEDYVEWVSQLLAHLFENQKVIVAGHSMGGAIAQQLALVHREQLKGIILVTTGAKLRVRPELLEELRQGKRNRDSFVASFSPRTHASIINIVEAYRDLTPLESAYLDFQACDQFDLRELIPRINLPTLIVGGEDDVITPPKYSSFLHDAIEGSTLVMIPHAGHYVMREQSEVFNSIVSNFVKHLDSM